MFHRIRLFAVGPLLLTPLIIFSTNSYGSPPEEKMPARVLVRVNGDPITEEAVLRRIQLVHGGVTRDGVNPGTWQRLSEAAVESEMLDLLLLQAAEKAGYTVSSEVLDRGLARTREMLGEEGYRTMLEKRGVNEEQFRHFLAERQLISRYRENLFKQVELSEEDLEAYYAGHPQRFALPERYRLYIMVFPDPEKAKSARSRLKEGKSFATLAEEHVAEGGKTSLTRPMPAEAIPEGMRDAVTAAPVGDVVQYDGPDGSNLIKVLEKIDGRERSFDEAKTDIRKHLRALHEQRLLNDWYEDQIEAATIEHPGEEGGDGS
jgi:parvulin-like peptidyl-prolyl isomerase